MTKSHIAQLAPDEIVMSIDVPIDVPLTMEFGRLTPIRPADDSSGIYPPNSKEGARVNVNNATVAALKAGLALHFRRQLKELTRDHRRACDEIPTIPHSVLAVRVGDTFTQDDGAADGGNSLELDLSAHRLVLQHVVNDANKNSQHANCAQKTMLHHHCLLLRSKRPHSEVGLPQADEQQHGEKARKDEKDDASEHIRR
jgi:hypothetical protein